MNIYWCTTDDSDEDWFVVAQTAKQAARFHEDHEGYAPGDAEAELICESPTDVEAKAGWPSDGLLERLGFAFLPGDGTRVVRFRGRVFDEGNVAGNAAIRLSVEDQEPS